LISIKGINTNITDSEVKQGNNLQLKWYFPESSGRTSFLINYRANGGLITQNNKNIIDWQAVGEEWQVPIHNLRVEIKLPQSVNKIEASPTKDISSITADNIIFKNKKLISGQPYRINLSFPLIIKTNRTSINKRDNFNEHVPALLVGLLAGLLITGISLLKRKKINPIKSDFNLNDFSLIKQAIIYANGAKNKTGVAAQIFKLAKKGNIKLVSEVKKSFLSSKNAEIRVEVLKEDDLEYAEKIIVGNLKKHKYLKKFANDYTIFKLVNTDVQNSLKEAKIISKKALNKRKSIYFTSAFLIILAVVLLIFATIKDFNLIIGLSPLFLIIGIGQLIKTELTPLLSEKGVYIKEDIEKNIDQKKNNLEQLIKDKRANEALQYFFTEIEYIMIHKKFNSTTLNKYKKVFKNADKIEIPDWIEFDLSNLNETIDALDIIEIIDYMMISIIMISANAGASTTGGASGGAGGGGGAAG